MQVYNNDTQVFYSTSRGNWQSFLYTNWPYDKNVYLGYDNGAVSSQQMFAMKVNFNFDASAKFESFYIDFRTVPYFGGPVDVDFQCSLSTTPPSKTGNSFNPNGTNSDIGTIMTKRLKYNEDNHGNGFTFTASDFNQKMQSGKTYYFYVWSRTLWAEKSVLTNVLENYNSWIEVIKNHNIIYNAGVPGFAPITRTVEEGIYYVEGALFTRDPIKTGGIVNFFDNDYIASGCLDESKKESSKRVVSYTFAGWKRTQDGNIYKAPNDYIDLKQNETFTAQWDSNTVGSNQVTTPSLNNRNNITKKYQAFFLNQNEQEGAPYYTLGTIKELKGYNSNGSAASPIFCTPGSVKTYTEEKTDLYTVWEGTPYENKVTIPTPQKQKIGYKFLYWDENGNHYNPGDSISLDNDANFYAIWQPLGAVTIYLNDGAHLAQPFIYDGKDWIQALPQIFNNNQWNTAG